MTTEHPLRDPRGLTVGVVVGAHGLHGGLRVRFHDPDSTALAPGVEVTLVHHSLPAPLHHAVRRCAHNPGERIGRLVLQGIGNRTAAEALRGAEVVVAHDALPELESDEFFLADLIGLSVRHADGGDEDLGVVRAYVGQGAQDLFEVVREVHGRKTSWLLPVVPGIIRDVDDATVRVLLPEGMGPDAEGGDGA